MKELSLVLPCYNEANSLPALVNRALNACQGHNLLFDQFELVLVDNGSTDTSAVALKKLASQVEKKCLKIVTVEKNQGYGYGVFQGLKACEGKFIGWSHADEQCDPADVFRGWKLLQNSSEKLLVKGRRRGRKMSRFLFSRCFEFTSLLLLRTWISEVNAQPKIFPRELLLELKNPPTGFSFDLYVLLKAKEAGYEFREISVLFPARKHGVSRWAHSFRSKWKTILAQVQFMMSYQ